MPRRHWCDPYGDRTRCGKSVYFQADNLRLALTAADVTCLVCRYSLAEPWHGTHGGYSNHNCRCAPCTEANTLAQQGWRERHRGMEPPQHGFSGYCNYGCRCEVCSQGHQEHQAAGARLRRERRVARGTS